MRSREFIKEASAKRIIIQKINDAVEGLVYILRKPDGDTVRDRSGQTLTYPDRNSAAVARDKMSDPSAVQGALDAEKKAPNAMSSSEAGKLGSGSFSLPRPDPSTGKLTQKTRVKDAEGKETGKVITKVYKDWADFAEQTGVWPAGSWRPGYAMQVSKALTAKLPIIGMLFTVSDLVVIGNIIRDWSMNLDAIRQSYKRNDYHIIKAGEGRQQAELEMQAVNKEYLTKLLKAVSVIIAANSVGKFTSMLSGQAAATTFANGIVSMFKAAGKTVNPSIVQTLTAGGLEAAKFFTATYAANAEFKGNIDNAIARFIITNSEWLVDLAGSALQLPVFGDLDLSVGTLSPADDAAMRKSAELNKEPATPAPAAGTPPKGPIDRMIDKFKSN